MSCLACDLAEGRLDLPGGRIEETGHWLVEHTVGPLGLGTLIVKPKRLQFTCKELPARDEVEAFSDRVREQLERGSSRTATKAET